MPRVVNKTLVFPLAGVVRSGGYRDQTRPYSAPWAVNVRGVAPLEGRERGGSRPGLSTFTGITTSTEGVFQWPNGENIEWPDGSDIEFALNSNLVTAPDGTSIIDPTDLITITTDNSTDTPVPSDYTVSTIYRDRVFVAKDNIFYASRIGNHRDWDFGAEMTDSARAITGTIELAGQPGNAVVGNDITAMIPFRDKILVMATCNSLHVLAGDPCQGDLEVIDENIGVIGPYAWAFNGDILAFLSNDGVYVGRIGQKPGRFSEGRIPNELKNVSTSNTITMAWDPGARGFHLFITPSSGTGNHYFLDLDNKAIWPVVFGSDDHQPVVAAKIKSANLERVILRGRDETWREFLSSATDDDGTTIQSHILMGPLRIAPNDARDAMLTELHGLMADIPSTVTWRVISGSMAETVADAAVADVLSVIVGDKPSSVDAEGTWVAGRNTVDRPRSRGAWFVLWISAETKWAYEAVAIVAQQLGRNR